MTRKPSCLISCSQSLPEGNLSVFVGRHRRDEPGREDTLQHAALIQLGKGGSQIICVAYRNEGNPSGKRDEDAETVAKELLQKRTSGP
jgi:hypothetical protein